MQLSATSLIRYAFLIRAGLWVAPYAINTGRWAYYKCQGILPPFPSPDPDYMIESKAAENIQRLAAATFQTIAKAACPKSVVNDVPRFHHLNWGIEDRTTFEQQIQQGLATISKVIGWGGTIAYTLMAVQRCSNSSGDWGGCLDNVGINLSQGGMGFTLFCGAMVTAQLTKGVFATLTSLAGLRDFSERRRISRLKVEYDAMAKKLSDQWRTAQEQGDEKEISRLKEQSNQLLHNRKRVEDALIHQAQIREDIAKKLYEPLARQCRIILLNTATYPIETSPTSLPNKLRG